MKIKLLLLLLFISDNISANENWIKIEPINKTQVSKSNAKKDMNLSQIEPINKIMKNATVIKNLIDITNKKEKPITHANHEKNWFVFEAKGNQ